MPDKVLQLKDMKVQHWADDDIYLITNGEDPALELSEDDAYLLWQWLSERYKDGDR